MDDQNGKSAETPAVRKEPPRMTGQTLSEAAHTYDTTLAERLKHSEEENERFRREGTDQYY